MLASVPVSVHQVNSSAYIQAQKWSFSCQASTFPPSLPSFLLLLLGSHILTITAPLLYRKAHEYGYLLSLKASI